MPESSKIIFFCNPKHWLVNITNQTVDYWSEIMCPKGPKNPVKQSRSKLRTSRIQRPLVSHFQSNSSSFKLSFSLSCCFPIYSNFIHISPWHQASWQSDQVYHLDNVATGRRVRSRDCRPLQVLNSGQKISESHWVHPGKCPSCGIVGVCLRDQVEVPAELPQALVDQEEDQDHDEKCEDRHTHRLGVDFNNVKSRGGVRNPRVILRFGLGRTHL